MKKNILSALALCAFVGFSSCDSFLELEPLDKVSGDRLTETDGGMKALLANVYSTVPMEDFTFRPNTGFNARNYDVAVSAGPGSFTGLRIGSATAKGLAMALDKQIVSVPTVDALAYNLWGSADVVCPLMDARRQQTYTGLYDFTDGRMNTILPQCVVMIEEIVDQINELGRRVIFLGDGVEVFRDYINEHVKVDYDFAPAMCNKQRASAVACLGQVLYEQGRVENAADHKPEYLRLSQAERERQEKERDFRI